MMMMMVVVEQQKIPRYNKVVINTFKVVLPFFVLTTD
jgi:hypothetical protein